MKAFRITVTFSDPYPKTKEYIETATKFDFACKKALSKFRKAFPGKRIEDFALRCQDLGTYAPEGVRTKVPVSRDQEIPTRDGHLCFAGHLKEETQEIPGLEKYLPE